MGFSKIIFKYIPVNCLDAILKPVNPTFAPSKQPRVYFLWHKIKYTSYFVIRVNHKRQYFIKSPNLQGYRNKSLFTRIDFNITSNFKLA